MTELRNDHIPFDQQVRGMSDQELSEQLIVEDQKLGDLGVTVPLRRILSGAATYGHNYEHVVYSEGGTKHTPLNCLMSTLNAQPELMRSSFDRLAEISGTLSRIAYSTQALVERNRTFKLPSGLRE